MTFRRRSGISAGAQDRSGRDETTSPASGAPQAHPCASGRQLIEITTDDTRTQPRRPRRRLTTLAALLLALAAGVGLALWLTAPEPRPEPTEADWYGGYDTGDFSQWTGVQAPPDHPPEIVEDPTREGGHAARFELRAGDRTDTGGYVSHRSEVFLGSNEMPLREGDDRWFGFSVMFGEDFGWHNGNQTVVQWKNDGTGSAPFDLRVHEDGRLCLADVRDWDSKVLHWCTPGPVETGIWHDFEVRARFSADPREGFVELRYEDEPQILSSGTRRDHFQTLEPGADSYVKQGYYTGTDFSYAGVVYHDAMRIGSRLSDVILPLE